MRDIITERETILAPEEFIGVLRRSGLAERRPVDDPARIAAMCANANVIICARANGLLVGVTRSMSDFAFFCYCSDLAVDRAYQKRGSGHALLEATQALLHPDHRCISLRCQML